MRRLFLFAFLFVSGCATAPKQPVVQPPVTIAPSPHVRSDLLGMSASDLIGRFGSPALQVREGQSLKLQFRGRGCVLDAYLYPPAGGHQGLERVTHVDTRLRSGVDTNQANCISELSAP